MGRDSAEALSTECLLALHERFFGPLDLQSKHRILALSRRGVPTRAGSGAGRRGIDRLPRR